MNGQRPLDPRDRSRVITENGRDFVVRRRHSAAGSAESRGPMITTLLAFRDRHRERRRHERHRAPLLFEPPPNDAIARWRGRCRRARRSMRRVNRFIAATDVGDGSAPS
jgi:hypothetical protein